MIVTHFYSLIYKKEVSGCFIRNCVMVVLAQFLSIIMPEIARTEKVCKKRYPTFLHGYKAKKSKAKQPNGNSSEESKVNVNCATANTKSDVISMCVVLALVQHKTSNFIVKMYVNNRTCFIWYRL